MSFLDKAKQALSDAADKVKDIVTENADKIEGAIDKAGDFIDEKTSGKFSETIDKVQGAAQTAADKVTAAADDVERVAAEAEADRPKLIVQFDAGPWPASGVLSEMGYRVGNTKGLSLPDRRHVLRNVVDVELVASSPETGSYIREWGRPGSAERVGKMTRCLYAFIRSAERRKMADMSGAIADWEADLAWLYEMYSLDDPEQ